MLLRRLLRPALLLAAALPFLAPTASAGDLSLGLKLGKRSSIHLSFGDRHHYRRCAPKRVWVPGCYTTVAKRVFVPGEKRKVWIEPVYETRYDDCGRPVRVLVCEGYWKVHTTPGRYVTKRVKVWKPGHWKTVY